MNIIRKGQIRSLAKIDTVGQMSFIECAFGIAAYSLSPWFLSECPHFPACDTAPFGPRNVRRADLSFGPTNSHHASRPYLLWSIVNSNCDSFRPMLGIRVVRRQGTSKVLLRLVRAAKDCLYCVRHEQ